MDLPLPPSIASQAGAAAAPAPAAATVPTPEMAAAAVPGRGTAAAAEDGLSVGEPIENAQQFFNWFARVEQLMERGREDVYRSGCRRAPPFCGLSGAPRPGRT